MPRILSENSECAAMNMEQHCLNRDPGVLQIRLEDRLEYELERALHHSVADRWNREDTDFAPVLRYLLPPTPAGLSPAEHASLRWTHNVARGFTALRSSAVGSQHC